MPVDYPSIMRRWERQTVRNFYFWQSSVKCRHRCRSIVEYMQKLCNPIYIASSPSLAKVSL